MKSKWMRITRDVAPKHFSSLNVCCWLRWLGLNLRSGVGSRTCSLPDEPTSHHGKRFCARTVHESNVFIPFGLLLSEKQIPRFVGNVSS